MYLRALKILLISILFIEHSIGNSKEENVKIQWLSELKFVTSTELHVDINLPRTLNTEKCTLTRPDGAIFDVGHDVVSGVTSHSSSNYVSCRVVVGPMDASLIGLWILCGSYKENNVEHRRCQRADIAWNSSNPDSKWPTTINPKFEHVVNFRGTLTPAVRGVGTVTSCHLVTPHNEDLFVTHDREYPKVRLVQNTDSVCSIAIGPIAESHLGDWIIYGTYSSVLFGHNEVRLPFKMKLYSKIHPYDQPYNVTTLNSTQHVVTLGSTIPVEVTSTGAVDQCQFTMPSGMTYFSTGAMPAGVSFVTDDRVACRLSIGPITQKMIGGWLLIGKFSNHESVEAIPNEVTIIEGNSIHVRLANPTDLHATCRLYDPKGQQSPQANLDGNIVDTCGFVVTSVDAEHSGTWNIVYGTKVIYKAAVLVNIIARQTRNDINLTWVENTSVNQTIGPKEAVYCRVLSPRGDVVFDDFGRCRVTIDRSRKLLHEGVWTMVVGLPGRIVTESHLFVVKLSVAEAKPEVSSSVSTNGPIVELTCSVTSAQEKTGCLFRNPAGEVLVASPGVSEGRYVFHVNQTTTESDSYYYSCALQILEPAMSDLGLWRCDLKTEEENYYGFPKVLCPWAMEDPDVLAVEAEPMLTAPVTWVSVGERDPVTLACFARAPLLYCYFRAHNGTVFNVGPGMSTPSMEYVGAGLDAGECGVRIHSLVASDSGNWSCHAGFNRQEQLQRISVFVQEEFVLRSSREHKRMMIEGLVGGSPQLEYCRYVRTDGFGFSSDHAPLPYIDESDLTHGLCRMRTVFSALDLHPWTVVAKIQGRDGEISRLTTHSPKVKRQRPIVELTCSVTSVQEKTGCLFRNPAGEVLVASPGVSEGRYFFHVNQTT